MKLEEIHLSSVLSWLELLLSGIKCISGIGNKNLKKVKTILSTTPFANLQ
jgi:hypothetical protein